MQPDLTGKREPRGTQIPPPTSFAEFRENAEQYFDVNGFKVHYGQNCVELRQGTRVIQRAGGFQELMMKMALMTAMTIAERPG